MLETKKINVVKIPNDTINEDIIDKNFPRMPRMYLELLENKDKIKPELLNKDYDPNDAESVISFYSSKDEKIQPLEKEDMEIIKEEEEELEEESENDSVSLSENGGSVLSSKVSGLGVNDNEDDDLSSVGSDYKPPSERVIDNDNLSEKESVRSFLSEKNEKKTMLKQMLQDETQKRPSPPRLSDLQREGMLKTNRTIPNLDYLEEQPDEDEEDKKRELLFKFELLKKSYKNVDIPEFTIHSSLKKMNETYENQLRHLSLDSSVENYKNILVGGFMIFEFIFGVWLKFDMSGFTQQQILNMNQYERLLIELGQKSYVPEGQQWPVEFRLLGLIVLNAVIFIISKMILKKTGSNLMGMMNHVQNPKPSIPVPKKKMKGPSIVLDDDNDEE
jgi:hypothetical protein